jgi:tetratricopeptide (TPR) repeat protein
MNWEQMTKATQLPSDDVILLSSMPHAVSLYSSGEALHEKLGETIRSMPELMQHRSELPVQAQVVLAEGFTREKNPEAETIYIKLLKKDAPVDSGWNKELLMVRLLRYYGAVGDPVKAAETNLQIAQTTQNEAWHGDSLVEAARYYRQAGQIDKAQELYQQAQKSSYGWAQGLAILDQSRALIKQGKYAEARKLLSTPVTGQYADQFQVVLLYEWGFSYYNTGELDVARNYLQGAIKQYIVHNVRCATLSVWARVIASICVSEYCKPLKKA